MIKPMNWVVEQALAPRAPTVGPHLLVLVMWHRHTAGTVTYSHSVGFFSRSHTAAAFSSLADFLAQWMEMLSQPCWWLLLLGNWSCLNCELYMKKVIVGKQFFLLAYKLLVRYLRQDVGSLDESHHCCLFVLKPQGLG